MKPVYPVVITGLCLLVPGAILHAQTTEVWTTHEVVGAIESPDTIRASDDIIWFSEAELDQMLAPVALYPDPVLSHVLVAATYPLEIVEADRWRKRNPHLDAEAALDAVQGQNWDASVKALVAFPQLLARLSEDLQWTRDLGDAFLTSEARVMDRVQALRQQAYNHGELRSSEHVRVVREQQTIIIEPAVERVVYLPVYDSRIVYGSWRWASYPPVYWDPWYPVSYRPHTTVYWGPAVRVTPAFYVSAFHWPQRHVVVVHNYSTTRWQHQVHHRRGVAYHPGYRPRYDQRSYRSNVQPRPQATSTRTRTQVIAGRADQQRSYTRSYNQSPARYRSSTRTSSGTPQHWQTNNRRNTDASPTRNRGNQDNVQQHSRDASNNRPGRERNQRSSGNRQTAVQPSSGQGNSRESRIRQRAQEARDAATRQQQDRSRRIR